MTIYSHSFQSNSKAKSLLYKFKKRGFTFLLSLSSLLAYSCSMNYPTLIYAQEETYLDLENLSEDFVIESKRIEVPGYPYAFNPSIIRWNGSLLMSFRVIPDPKNSFNSLIGLVQLDEDFNPISIPQILNTRGDSDVPSRAEDARLIQVGNRLFMVYSDNRDEKITRGGFRVYLGEVIYDGVQFKLEGVECLSEFEGQSQLRREKNWTPFDYEGNLLLAYSLEPHRIFHPLFGTGACETIATTQSKVSWDWGELRGGTTALPIDNDHYLSFFHSSKDLASVQSSGKVVCHYFLGAYLFQKDHPFRIKKVSPRPIIGKGYYTGAIYKPYWKPILAVFPCGFIQNDEHIWIFYGKHDHEVWVSKLDKRALLESLIDVEIGSDFEL